MNNKYLITKVSLLGLYMIIPVLFYLIYLYFFNNLNEFSDYKVLIILLSWVGITLFGFIIFTWRNLTGEIFTPYIIFMVFFFLFNFGQSLMWAVGIHIDNEIGNSPIYPGYDIASSYDIVRTQLLVLISILMFHIGAVFTVPLRKNKKPAVNELIDSKQTLTIMFYICLIINIVVSFITMYALIDDVRIARMHGYSALYYSEFAKSGFSIFELAHMFFFPTLIGLILGSRLNKSIRIYVYTVFAVYLMLNVSIGERGTWVFKLIIFVWIIHKVHKRLNYKFILKLLPISVIGLYILNAIVSLRNTGMTLENIKETLSIHNSPIIDAFFEMGSSMNPTLFMLKYGWEIWPYPNSYFSAVGGIFSNKILDYFDISWDVVNNFFKDYLNISWGPAFSIVAEPLMNFGPYLSPLFMIVLGFLIVSVIYIDDKINYQNRPLKILFAAGSLEVLIHLNRNDLHIPIKNWLYGVVFLCLLIYLLKVFLYRKIPDKNSKSY